MGTRAVVHVDLRKVGYGKDIWIATHWDGHPETLGKNLKQAIETEKKVRGKDWKKDMGGLMQTAIGKATAEHHIDSYSLSKEDFNKQYGDYAQFEYEINPKTGKIKFRPLKGFWLENPQKGKWKSLNEERKARDSKKIKKVV